ncbi:Mitochondrial inner membrane magnesium transporter-like protein [Hapsidospora chrysogenum ATCC 11550]|uniref:Magnesium transporter n=1 Tax=Hapsidospora chrysogenum (strain ATCC 11550 / CBS 779.69 / DSM 880 / IAM 14645 / JCM 23072 / IMI 49137) TaxID=857340 RepID=A0A086T1Q5_HAPC1|nr:Mitochondrial inner membrane magnesium transporter-like protein [Hapsidospora chrysogenum ATCC 11550]
MSVAAAAACRVPVPLRAPSRSLLRFLRLQSEIPLPSAQNAGRRAYTTRRWPTRKLSTLCPHQHGDPKALNLATRQSPRCFSKKSQTPPTRRCFGTTGAAYKVSEPDTIKTAHATSWQERLWGSKAKTGKKPLRPDDLPSHENLEHGSMFTSRRTLAAKAAAEPRLRCTEVDEYGKAILVDGEFKKSELIAKYGLLPRDLRKIDSSNLPHILVRPSAILLNLLHLKVLIKHDRVLLFDVYGSKTSYSQSAFMYDLQGKLQQKSPSLSASGGLPYEFRALETVLTSVTSELEADFEAVREPVMHILSELEDDIDRQKLRMLLILSKRVSTFEQKAKLVRDAIEELLEADDDLAAMYLTEKAHDIRRGMDDHTEVEMLLESYHKLTDEIVQEAGNLVSGIRNTEEIVRAILDANRNALMLLDLKFSIGTLGLAMGTFIAGLYGMNLENFIEETDWGFGSVTGASIVFSLFVCWYGLGRLRRVQRIKMGSEERPHLPRRQIFHHQDDALGLLDARHRERLRRMNMQKTAATKKKWWSLRF